MNTIQFAYIKINKQYSNALNPETSRGMGMNIYQFVIVPAISYHIQLDFSLSTGVLTNSEYCFDVYFQECPRYTKNAKILISYHQE